MLWAGSLHLRLGLGWASALQTFAHPTPEGYGLRNTLEPLSFFFLSFSLPFLSLLVEL
jgi:hypothetical protein